MFRRAGAAAPGAGGVAALDHKVADHTVKEEAIVIALLGKKDKVVDCFGRMLSIKLDHNAASWRFDGRLVILLGVDLHIWGFVPLFHNEVPLCFC